MSQRTDASVQMPMRPLGASGAFVARIGQGTWRVHDVKAAAVAIEEGIRLGMTHIDTAELYEENSRSETMLGPIVARHPGRLFVASKVLPHHATSKGIPSACKDSMVRLQVEQLDLYYHHWRGEGIPLEETLRALADLVDKGWVRHIGVSNYDVADLEEALAILGPRRIVANQILYHLEDRGAESEVIPWCKQHGLAVVAYSTFGAGSFVRDPRRVKALDAVALRVGKSARQVALAFLTRDPAVVAIPKAESVAHVRDNAGGAFDLPKNAIEDLDAAFAVRPGLRTI